jgi:hypothetical protein
MMMQKMAKVTRRIVFKGVVLGEFEDGDWNGFSACMHEIMLRVGMTPDEGEVKVETITQKSRRRKTAGNGTKRKRNNNTSKV